ncbi:MAG: uracil-DNA glycosylase family protein [Woeseiaceae bacterium]
MSTDSKVLIEQVINCRLCADELPLGPRPILQIHTDARVLIAGQAPGSKVHETGIPFDDPSGDRLRDWMGIDRRTFYDPKKVAILPMGFCYPGRGKSGDLPPLKRCADTWRLKLLTELKDIRLTLVIGQYAMRWHLEEPKRNLTETVRGWRDYGNNVFPLPHPSPRNNIWLKKNAWFEGDVLPHLRDRVQNALYGR